MKERTNQATFPTHLERLEEVGFDAPANQLAIFESEQQQDIFPTISLPLLQTEEERLHFAKMKKKYPQHYAVPSLTPANEATDEMLEVFFEEQKHIERLILCPAINLDLRDDWGFFGSEPGYFFVTHRRKTTVDSLNDEMFAKGAHPLLTTKQGDILVIGGYDYFPQSTFGTQVITQTKAPKTYTFLNRYLGITEYDIKNAGVQAKRINPIKQLIDIMNSSAKESSK